MSKGPGRVQLAVTAELAKLRGNDEVRTVEDLCLSVFGRCDKKHRVSVLRALPCALVKNPHLERDPYATEVRIRINYQRRPAWRRRLMRDGAW